MSRKKPKIRLFRQALFSPSLKPPRKMITLGMKNGACWQTIPG